MSLTCRILTSTIAKQSTVPASKLENKFKAALRTGDYPIEDWEQSSNGHFKVTFVDAIGSMDGVTKYKTWVIYRDYLTILGEDGKPDNSHAIAKDGLDLKVPFFAQVARKAEPTFKSQWEQNRTCNTSSCAMAAKFLGAKIIGDDDFYSVVKRYGDTTDHSSMTHALDAIGIKSQWRTNLDFEDLEKSIANGKPAILGILHRGTLDYPTGGHMIVCRGITSRGDIIANDPYGSLLDGYTEAVENGERVIYPRSIMKRRWTVDGFGSGWGRLF